MEYDIVIVGAGPGGLNAARFLEGKRRVLIIEANRTIGPKVCAGGLFNHGIEYLGIPESLLEISFNRLKLFTNLQNVNVQPGFPFIHTIQRERLAEFQLKMLKKTEIVKDTPVTEIADDYVVAGGKRFGYKDLIGADGSNSIVRRYLGLETRVGATLQYKVPGRFKDMELHFIPRFFKIWYAWIFPAKDYAMIGCGCDPRYLLVSELKSNFKSWLKSRNIDVSSLRCEGFPISWLYKGYAFKNRYLVGDAAGLASSITGEGIYQAMLSGEMVAKKILGSEPDMSVLMKMKRKEMKLQRLSHLPGYRLNLEVLAFMMRSGWFSRKVLSYIG